MITQEQLIHDFAEQNTPQINKELFVRSEDAAIRELQNVRLKTKHRFLLFSFVHCPSLHKIYAKLSALSKKVK